MAGQVPYTGVPQNVDAGISRFLRGRRRHPASFGGQIGQALQRGGATLDQAGGQLMGAAIRQQELLNKTASMDAMNNYQDGVTKLLFGDPNNPSDVGYYGMKGKQAIDAYPAVRQQVEQTPRADQRNHGQSAGEAGFRHLFPPSGQRDRI